MATAGGVAAEFLLLSSGVRMISERNHFEYLEHQRWANLFNYKLGRRYISNVNTQLVGLTAAYHTARESESE